MSGNYWSIVKANISPDAPGGQALEDELNEWWSDHQGEYVEKDGFTYGWRARLTAHDHPGVLGTAPHKYHAIYEVDEIAVFNKSLLDGTISNPGDPWGPWQSYVDDYVLDWERTYYKVLYRHEAKTGQGKFFACIKFDIALTDDKQESAFDDWYTNTHVPEICSYPGIYRAWRLEVAPDDGDLGNRRQRFWGVYEVDSPDNFAHARQDRTDKGIKPFDGLWLDKVINLEISFYDILYQIDHDTAKSSRGSE
ncbi:hypothetical protein AADZ91_13220 [Colwelliaceae bacterium 6441]